MWEIFYFLCGQGRGGAPGDERETMSQTATSPRKSVKGGVCALKMSNVGGRIQYIKKGI